MKFLMHIGTGAFGLDAALEASIVPIIGDILDLQIINAALRLKVESAIGTEN